MSSDRTAGLPLMRVVHIHQAGVTGGLLRVVGALADVQSRDHAVTVIGPLTPPGAEVDVHHLDIAGNGDVAAHVELRRVLRKLSPDVVELHAGSPGELATAAVVAERRAPAVVVEHLPTFFPLETRKVRLLARWAKRRASAWVSVSADGGRHLEEHWGLAPGTLRVVHNGVAAPRDLEPEPELCEAASRQRFVLGLGVPQERKGYGLFAALAQRAAPVAPDLGWYWVGAPAAGRDGAVSLWPWQESAGWLLRRAEALLVPSRAEGCPLVVLEAFACGAPVVASAVGGIPEVVVDGVNGLLAPPGDPAAWEHQVARLLADGGLRQRLAAAAVEAWRDRFTAEAMARRHERILDEVVRRRQA